MATKKNAVKSARYQFSWELPTLGGKTAPQNQSVAPNPVQVEMNAGKKKKAVKGGTVVLNRGEMYGTEDEPQVGAGLLGTVGNIADSVFGLGKPQKKCGGRKPMTNKPTQAQMKKMLKAGNSSNTSISTSTEFPLGSADAGRKVGAGILGDVGNVVDSIFGLGKHKPKPKASRGGAKDNKDLVQNVTEQLKELEGGVKRLKQTLKKIK